MSTTDLNVDVIVLGVGGIGSATLYQLARRGFRALGIDQFAPGHDRGSSHGETRVIRTAYFEHPDYVPLARTSFELWRELEELVGRPLLYAVGLLQGGPESGVVVSGIRRSAAHHDLDVRSLTGGGYPNCFRLPETTADHALLFEAGAGYLMVEACVQAYVSAALDAGAQVICDQPVIDWQANDRTCTVRTTAGVYSSRHLVLALGAGQRELCKVDGLALRVLRKHLYWYAFQPRSSWAAAMTALPIFLFESSYGVFYGFPSLDARTIKVARHSGGTLVSEAPFSAERPADLADQKLVERFLREYLGDVALHLDRQATCLYTMSPDEHFRVGFHPQHRNVVLAAGLSGHGFKFAPVLGAALADLIEHGGSQHAIEFLAVGNRAS